MKQFGVLGVTISTVHGTDPSFTLNQSSYITPLRLLLMTSPYDQFVSTRAELAWLSHTRSDLC